MSKRDSTPMVAEDDPGFARFWNAYGKRRSKKDARAAWSQLNPSPELVDRICTALDWQFQQRDWMKDDGQYAPLPATYLRAERWTDEPPRKVAVVTKTTELLKHNVDVFAQLTGRKAV